MNLNTPPNSEIKLKNLKRLSKPIKIRGVFMNYSVRTKEKWHALPICGSDEFLTTCEEIKSIEGAKWIWQYFYTRNLL